MITPERMLPIRALLPILVLAAVAASGCGSGKPASTSPAGALRIVSVTADPDTVPLYGQSILSCTVDNPGGDVLSYQWSTYSGSIQGQGATARYFGAYCCDGIDWVQLTVTNDRGEQVTHLLTMTVLLN